MAMHWPWRRWVGALGDAVERRTDADGDRLLADIATHDAVNLAGHIVVGGALLEAADRQHPAQHLALRVGRERLRAFGRTRERGS